jgi:hypothetical protein
MRDWDLPKRQHKSRTKDEVDAAAHFVLADNSAREMQDYILCGRQFERESTDALKARLIDRFRKWAVNPRGRHETLAVNDLLAEYEIRGIEWPAKEVKPEIEAIRQAAKAALESCDDEELERREAAIWERWEAAQKSRQ